MKEAKFYAVGAHLDANTSSPLRSQIDRKYLVEWGLGKTYKVICEDEDHVREFERHSAPLTGVTKLYFSTRMFLTMAEDREVHVCANTGRLLHTLTGHTGSIMGTIELTDKRLLTVGEQSEIKLWNPKNGQNLATIPAKVNALSAIKMFHQSPHFAVSEANSVSIWNYEGERVTMLDDVKTEITDVLNLSGGRWLVNAMNTTPGIWNRSGQRICDFRFHFDFRQDLLELDDHRLLIKEPNERLSLWDEQGGKISHHEPSDALASLFSDLQEDFKTAERHFLDHPNVGDYPHIRNPVGNKGSVLCARDEIEEQQLDLEDPMRKRFWDFFNRPLFDPIKTALKEQIRRSREALTSLEAQRHAMQAQIEDHQNRRRKHALLSLAGLVLAAIGAGLTYAASHRTEWVLDLARAVLDMQRASPSNAAMVATTSLGLATGVCALLCLASFSGNRKQKRLQHQKEENLALLDTLPDIVTSLIDNIKTYRRRILKQIPVMQDRHIFNGVLIREEMQSIVHGKLEQMARDECGLEKEDIIYTDHQAIVLKDWALIQDQGRRKQVMSKLNTNNENSFWSASGEMLFAVQFIQYIFLTEDKVDVFTTYYDFISNRCLGREANAFYYKDVTNIAKREVERKGQSTFNASDVSATEIALSVASGEKIRLTILNEDSASALADSAKDNENLSIPERLERLKAQRHDFQEDTSMSEEEKQDELDVIESQISDLQNQVLEQNVEKISSKADEAIKNIRAQLQQHKQYEMSHEALNESVS
ncbi:hypothetical protein [Vibrio coralliilyticus]|uniref:Uncharacterized protein n=1 Tax=Vibrio coralliilyticus TaxID=190893 RepID=A0AAP6ZLG5_9VIBR|nr:hypothetical protein [Vibrio coralliilyticus]NOJ24166.1 hypothetical protein [Vibrio coralliilyticus]